jgi:hypothetical protein
MFSINIGDRVVSADGLIGRIVGMHHDRVDLEICGGVEVQVLRVAIVRGVNESERVPMGSGLVVPDDNVAKSQRGPRIGRETRAWPDPKADDTAAISRIVNDYFDLPVGSIIDEKVPDPLFELTGARRYSMERSVWAWLAAWCVAAENRADDLVLLQVAAFVFEWNREYTSGPGIMLLGKPNPEHLDTVGNFALAALNRTPDWNMIVVNERNCHDVYDIVIRWTMRDYIEDE